MKKKQKLVLKIVVIILATLMVMAPIASLIYTIFVK